MDTEATNAKISSRHGVAMFVVLGAIVLVTLFGYVGITLAGRDQTLSGDLNDIKSRDEAAIASLQFGINRLVANPTQLVALLNAFVADGRAKFHATSNAKPDSTWLVFDPATNTIVRRPSEPDWFSLSTDAGNQTAMKLQILGIGAGDSTVSVADKKDSAGVYISLRGLARGRHGDVKVVQGAYRIHGVSVDYRSDSSQYTVPNYAFYLGTYLSSCNLGANINGDVFIAGGNTINSSGNDTIKGMFKWQGNFSTNANLVVNGIAYISGSLTTNGGFTIRFNDNAAITGGLSQVNAPIVAAKNLWIGGPGGGGAWNGGAPLKVVGDLVWVSSSSFGNIMSDITVGGDAWFVSGTGGGTGWGGFPTLMSGQLTVGGDLRVGGSPTAPVAPMAQFGYGTATVTGNIIAPRANLSFGWSGGGFPSIVNGSLWSQGIVFNLRIGQKADIDGMNNVSMLSGASVGTSGSRTTALAWKPTPTAQDEGIPAAATFTTVAQNPMDSIKIDSRTPDIQNAVVTLTNALMLAANPTLNDHDFSDTALNGLYKYLDAQGKLYNGYMLLKMDNAHYSISSLNGNTGTGFRGKVLFIVEGQYNINSQWPSSHDSTNIQIIVQRNGGLLNSWGWSSGSFAGIFYLENTPCGGTTVNLGSTGGKWWGGFIVGSHLDSALYGYSGTAVGSCGSTSGGAIQFNAGTTTLIKSDNIYMDIGVSLPGILIAPAPTLGQPTHVTKWSYYYRRSPLLRLIHNRPYFEPIGVFR